MPELAELMNAERRLRFRVCDQKTRRERATTISSRRVNARTARYRGLVDTQEHLLQSMLHSSTAQ